MQARRGRGRYSLSIKSIVQQSIASSLAPNLGFQAIFESVPGQFLVVLPDAPRFTIVAASDAYLRTARKTREELMGRGLFEVFNVSQDEDSRSTMANLMASFLKVAATGEPDYMPVQHYDLPKPEGGGMEERYWSPINCSVIGKSGAVEYIIHRVEDVTELLRLRRTQSEGADPAEQLRMHANRVETELFLRSSEIAELKQLTGKIRQVAAELSHIQGRQSLLLSLLQGQRATSDPEVMMRSAAQAVGEYLKIDRIGFFEVQEDDTLHFLAGWTSGRLPDLISSFPAAWIGTLYLEEVRAGRTLGIADARTHPLTKDSRFAEIGTVSLIGVPIIRNGLWHGGFCVNHAEVRHWTDEEISLVRDVGEQTWDAVERARAESALRKNVTDLISARKQIEESERQFRTLAESIPPLTWMAHPDGHIFWYNRRWYEYTGTAPEQMEGWGWTSVHDPEMLPEVMERWKSSLHKGAPFEMVFPLKGAGGEFRPFLTRVEPVKDEDGKVVRWFGTNTDITEQTRTAEKLRSMNRELEEFAYVASHDLQEPLRMVNCYTQLLLRDHVSPDNKDAQEFAKFVYQGVRRMEELIHDLLSYSGSVHRAELIAATDNQTADLNASWAEALAVLDGRINESGAVVTADPFPSVRGDATQFAHVFQNLLSNAIKYQKETVAPKVNVTVECKEGMCIVAVRDNGIGFDQQYAQGIFGLFKRLHRDEYPGTGLGLAICQRIVERYRGRIWAESEPGAGSTFFMALPLAEDSTAGAPNMRGGSREH